MSSKMEISVPREGWAKVENAGPVKCVDVWEAMRHPDMATVEVITASGTIVTVEVRGDDVQIYVVNEVKEVVEMSWPR